MLGVSIGFCVVVVDNVCFFKGRLRVGWDVGWIVVQTEVQILLVSQCMTWTWYEMWTYKQTTASLMLKGAPTIRVSIIIDVDL